MRAGVVSFKGGVSPDHSIQGIITIPNFLECLERCAPRNTSQGVGPSKPVLAINLLNSLQMALLRNTTDPVVIRTDFDNQQAWETICRLIRTPVHVDSHVFNAYVEFYEDITYRNLTTEDVLENVPRDYKHTFLFVIDEVTVSNPDFPVLVVNLSAPRGRSFRAIPSEIQGIENNLSIANMDFEDFAEAVDEDGVFRGFPM
jgi:hypothetical protein